MIKSLHLVLFEWVEEMVLEEEGEDQVQGGHHRAMGGVLQNKQLLVEEMVLEEEGEDQVQGGHHRAVGAVSCNTNSC